MTDEMDDLQRINTRLAGIESQLRQLRWMLAAVMLILVCLLLAPMSATLLGVVLPLIIAAIALGYFVYLMRGRSKSRRASERRMLEGDR